MQLVSGRGNDTTRRIRAADTPTSSSPPAPRRQPVAAGVSRMRIGLRHTCVVSSRDRSRAVLCDYDARPERMRLARDVLCRHGAGADVHAPVAARLVAEDMLPVLDVGCGEGELARHLPAGAWAGVDSSPRMVAGAPAGAQLGPAYALPFNAASFRAAALLYVLYHLDDPARALAEARRVVRTGGLIVTAASSRHDSPELAFALPNRSLTFDAELAPNLMAEHLAAVEVESWDRPLTLPDHAAIRDYLIGKGTTPARAVAAAREVHTPLTVTKRGALVWGQVPA